MRMMRRAERKYEVTYSLFFESVQNAGSGMAFDCDEDGMLLEPVHENVELAREKVVKGEYREPFVQDCPRSWTEPARIECDCGQELDVPDLTNECGYCGRLWNWAGQGLDPVQRHWGEETGEHWCDVVRGM